MPGHNNSRFSSLVEPHLDALFRTAYRLTRNRADAEDLVQETCMRACVRLAELRGAGPVKAWLLKVLYNQFVDGARRARLSPVDRSSDGTELASTSVCPAPTPEESLDFAQRLGQLERAWRQLDRGHRVLLALRAEGYSLAEISRITNIEGDALTMRLYRARQSLTRCLHEQQEASSAITMEAVK